MQHLAFRHGAVLLLAAQLCAVTLACRVDGDIVAVSNALTPASNAPSSNAPSSNAATSSAATSNASPSSAAVSKAPAPAPSAAPANRMPAPGSNGAPSGNLIVAARHGGPTTLYLAGGGTVQAREPNAGAPVDRSGWGEWLAQHTSADVTVDNRAVAERSARRFIDEGRLDEILAVLLPDDYLLIEFGTADADRRGSYQLGDERIPYYFEPATDFKVYLDQYIAGAREHGALPILVTPPAGRTAYCTGSNATEAQARAVRELGQARNVPVIDLNAQSVAYLAAICPAPQREGFFAPEVDGSRESAFRDQGARTLAGFVANAIAQIEPGLLPSDR